MTRLRIIFLWAFCALTLPGALYAQPVLDWVIQPLTENGWVEFDYARNLATATNGVLVKYGGAVLTADQASVDLATGEVVADGNVRIQREAQIWVSEHVRYNFKTRQLQAEQFRTGKPPVFAAGQGLHGERTSNVYVATNAIITSDDIANPAIKVRAKSIRIVWGERIEARSATLYVEGVPVFYFPYFSRRLGPHANHFNFIPGYRTSFGPYLLGSYNWYLNEELDGTFHFDYRERRGPGLGPDVNYHLGPWGDGTFKYYYTHDENPNVDVPGASNPENRQRLYFSYQSMPQTNLSVKGLVRYQGDTNIVREFFESEYRENPQPNTWFEVNKFWQNFSLDAYVQPRVNTFLETVERLPDVRLTGYRQQLGESPFYYESESSAGYYRRLFPEIDSQPTGLRYSAARADTYHQVVLPETFFGWLNVTPRVGGRYTYYSEASGPGAVTEEQSRGVFNTGAEVNFKASRTWPGIRNDFLEMDGLRHIIQPSVNYVYVPRPNVVPTQLPQFDTVLPSMRLLPIEFPEFNAIDAIDSENVLRLGLNNRAQTKRLGAVANVVNWDLYTDWRLRPRSYQTTFSDAYSDLTLRPRSWLTLESLTRYNLDGGQWRMAFHTLTFQPNDVWSWSLGHYYLQDDFRPDPTATGIGNSTFNSAFYYRLNENWGMRAAHRFEARTGILQEQAYTVYRDLRSWTAALTLRLRDNPIGPNDVTVAFTFSLKAFPRYGLGADTVRPYTLWGG